MHRLSDQQKARLTTWIVDQHRARERMPKVTSDVIDETNQRRPLRMSERKTRFLLLASLSNFQASSTFKISGNTDDKYWHDSGAVCAWTESSSVREAQYFVGLLYQDGIVRLVDNSGAYQLTSKGFAQLEAVETGGASLRQCFIAMWFDPSMEGARKAIEEAVQDCDYRPMRIDAKEHGNKIDDEIIAEIRRSRFVVADFTCPTTDLEDKSKAAIARGGVYYEAGFAQGLRTPVIWTCRKDCLAFVHFDTRQYNHIDWQSPEELRQRLVNRIRAMVI
jgi:hypothetical protein